MLLPGHTVALLLTLALGFHVLTLAPHRGANRIFAAFAWLTALWLLNDLVFWANPQREVDGRAWARGAMALGLGMHLSFLSLAWVFPSARPVPRRARIFLGVVLALTLAALVHPQLLAEVGRRGTEFQIAFTPWTFVAGGGIYVVHLTGLGVVADKLRRCDDPQLRSQLRALLLSTIATAVVSTVMAVVLPLAGHYALLPYVGVGLLVGTTILGVGVLRARLLVPDSVLDRVRLFPLGAKLGAAIAAATLLIVGVVWWVQHEAATPAHGLVFALIAATLPALGLMFAVQRIVTVPLRQLSEAALRVAGGERGLRVELNTRDEVSVLGESFNAMVTRLEEDLQSLQDMSEGLLRAERLVVAGTLASGVAHEVNNPLAAVSSLVQSARERNEDPRSRQMLEEAVTQIERVGRVLTDLTAFARPSRPSEARSCALKPLLERTVALLRYDRRFRRLPIRLEVEALEAEVDPDRLQQVLVNLLLNARDAVDGDGSVTLRLREGEAQTVCLEVQDDGRGIPEDAQARIFEPFFTTKPPGAGTGLGLAVCREIIQQAGGRIELESAPDAGTTVRLHLPRGAALPASF